MQNDFYNPCTAYCALSVSDNSRVGVATLLHVTNWFCITNQYNYYKNHFAHLLINAIYLQFHIYIICVHVWRCPRGLKAYIRHFEGKILCVRPHRLIYIKITSYFYKKASESFVCPRKGRNFASSKGNKDITREWASQSLDTQTNFTKVTSLDKRKAMRRKVKTYTRTEYQAKAKYYSII